MWREREHRSTRRIKVPGDQVESVDRPCGDRSEANGLCADASVHNGGGCGREFAGHAGNGVGIDTNALGDSAWRKWFNGVGDLAKASGHAWCSSGIDQIFGKQHVQHRT